MRANTVMRLSPQLSFLTGDQMEILHHKTLEVLEHTGVQVLHEEARELLRGAGAIVKENSIVKIPEFLIKKALSTAPSRIVLANRDGERSLFLEPGKSYYGTGSDCPYTIDAYTQERRMTSAEDVGNLARICDYLDNIDFVMSMGIARHQTPSMAGRRNESDRRAPPPPPRIQSLFPARSEFLDYAFRRAAPLPSAGRTRFYPRPLAPQS